MKQLFKVLPTLLLAVAMVVPAVAGDYGDDKDDQDNKFTVKGEIRIRGEYIENSTDFNSDTPDSVEFWPARFRIAAKGDLGSDVYVYTEVQSAGIWGDDFVTGPFPGGPYTGLEGEASFDTTFYQGWIAVKDIGDTSWSLKMGRQEITQGNELLFGNLDFYNGIVHDGIQSWWDFDSFKLRAWWIRNTENAIFGIPNRDRDHNYYAASAVWNWNDNTELELYAIQDSDDAKTGLVRLADYWTIGGRVTHEEKGDGVFNWSGEYAMQTGNVGVGGVEVDQDAFVFEGSFGYMWGSEGDLMHNVHIGYTLATGDDPTTTDIEAFNPLFQDFHWRLGLADFFTTTDIEAIEAGYKMMVGDNQKWGATYYMFTTEQDVAGEDDLGSELDIYYKYHYTENLSYHAALAYFTPGDLLAPGAAPDDPVMRLYGQVSAKW